MEETHSNSMTKPSNNVHSKRFKSKLDPFFTSKVKESDRRHVGHVERYWAQAIRGIRSAVTKQ